MILSMGLTQNKLFHWLYKPKISNRLVGMIVGGTSVYFAMCSPMPFGINSEVNSSTKLNSKIASYSLQVAIKKQYRTKLADELAKVKS